MQVLIDQQITVAYLHLGVVHLLWVFQNTRHRSADIFEIRSTPSTNSAQLRSFHNMLQGNVYVQVKREKKTLSRTYNIEKQ